MIIILIIMVKMIVKIFNIKILEINMMIVKIPKVKE